MPTPEKIKFYEAHLDEMNSIIIKENTRRNASKEKLLTEEDIDSALDNIIEFVAAGNKLSEFKFNVGEQQVKSKEIIFNSEINIKDSDFDCMNFSISRCKNGFLLKSNSDRFIFRNQKELLKIISSVLVTDVD